MSKENFPASSWNEVSPWNVQHASTATAADIFYCFRLLLGRSPHREEWTGHAAHTGADLDTVIKTYIGSLEFARRSETMLARTFDDRLTLLEQDGFSLYVQDGDVAVGQCLKSNGEYEPHVTSIFKGRLKSGMQVLDIGANIGYFTMLASSLVTSAGSVMAIEPNPDNTKLIEASRRANGFDNITIVQAAAGCALGLLVLNTSYSNGTTGRLADDLAGLIASTTVATVKLDDLINDGKRIDFIKIDVEGAEYNALRGATNAIKQWRPTIVSEFGPDMMPLVADVTGAQYLDLLLDFGYEISVIERDGSLTSCGRDVSRVMNAYVASGIDHIDILMEFSS